VETYLTIEGLAEYLKLAEQTIRRWVLNREVPFCKIRKVIRFRVSEIEKWVDDGGILKATPETASVEDGLYGDETESVDSVEDEQDIADNETGKIT
jgi:excisionase family DNA binding protein